MLLEDGSQQRVSTFDATLDRIFLRLRSCAERLHSQMHAPRVACPNHYRHETIPHLGDPVPSQYLLWLDDHPVLVSPYVSSVLCLRFRILFLLF